MIEHVVLGGARSGKTAFAERATLTLAENAHVTPLYIATAVATDPEMRARIERHVQLRASRFVTREAPRDMLEIVDTLDPDAVCLIDCLATYMGTLWHDAGARVSDDALIAEGTALLEGLARRTPRFVIVSNEVGMGIVPETAAVRMYRDALGRWNALAAALAARVTLTVAGIPVQIKPSQHDTRSREQELRSREQELRSRTADSP
ncbi:bifunctional adenosylcobinamide kinase/adenosylcobinamide-phosphate guanylyltransferase [Ferroacidibacillus organovorans]|uniref:Adenosylcobinamide kinase n=1 Tax=Ferroacidibacillus organovorans TaxID=1765683 RepID=A0A1V4EY73_9BACL|nr:bifunctional adenosylcobinamide kinase/adenosylcobinamide-phosphate guanylyltransferase [Ferroacidibacillus organovorans]OPG17598.1 hypothetical protein B2M26_00110 [Ferroacidibacillus organovorans]